MCQPSIVLVAAVSENGVIGRDGDMPWHLPADLKHFKKTTLGHPIIMGRRTWDSIGRPLPGRTNIVMTRDASFAAEGAHRAGSVSEAIGLCGDQSPIMVIGGGEIYKRFLPSADRIELTRVHVSVDGDTFFPELGDQWNCHQSIKCPADELNPISMTFETWNRAPRS